MAAPRPLLLAVAALCCLAALPAARGAGATTAPSKDIVIGNCNAYDKLLHVETVRLSSKWMQVQTAVVAYPVAGQAGGVISCVRLQNLKTKNEYVGTATIQRGGPGLREVVVRVKSDRGHSVSWNVLVYGSQ